MSWTVATVMAKEVVTVPPGAAYKEVAERMHEHRVSALPVVDPEHRVIGVVSEADLLLKEERPMPGRGPLADPQGDAAKAVARNAAALMTSPAVTVRPGASLTTVAVEDGVVRLEGELETCSLGRILTRLVGAVEGVVGVDSRLRWKLDDTGLRPDTSPLALHFAADERE